MSFILDALRKSEARRRSGRTPRLDDDHDRSYSSRPARSRLPGVLIGSALAVVVAVAVVFLRPELVGLGERTTADATNGTPGAPESGQGPPPQPLDERLFAVAEDREDQELAEQAGEDEPERRQRRVRRPAPETDEEPVEPAQDRTERELVIETPEEAMEELARRGEELTAIEPQRQDEAAEEPDEPVQRRRRREPPPEDPDPEPEIEEIEKIRDVAEYVRSWELPLSVRRDLPDLKLSIHVYTPEEDRRFVLINGERYVPGDQLEDDATLVDIRREGAIVDFREHRFLLEP